MSTYLLLLGFLALATCTQCKYLPINSTATCPQGWSSFNTSYSCYQYFEIPKTWSDARSFCQKMYGADLVSIESEEENAFVFKLTDYFIENGTWIGFNCLSKYGTWVWSDGSAVSYSNWISPLHAGTCCLCAQLLQYPEYRYASWANNMCNYSKPFVCKKSVGNISKLLQN